MLEKNLKILFYLKTKKKNFIKNNNKTINNLKDFLNKFQSNIFFSMCIQCIELLFK